MNSDGRGNEAGTADRPGAIPSDLLLVIAFLVLADVVLFATPPGSVPYLVVAVPLLLFVPGYVLLAAVFPRHRRGSRRDGLTVVEEGPTWTDRLVLSFPVSLALVPLVGGLLLALDRPFEPMLIAGVLSAVVLLGTVLAWLRRWLVPADERLGLPVGRWSSVLRSRWLGTGSLGEVLATVALLVSVLLVVASLALAAGVPASGDSYTSLTLLSENATGELTADGFSTEIVRHQAVPVVARVTNSEGTDREYTLVVRVEQLSAESDEIRDAHVQSIEELSVPADDTVDRTVTVTPREVGANQRVSFYLYRGDAPGDVGPQTAYRHAYLSISVGESSE